MIVMTLWSLCLMIQPWLSGLLAGQHVMNWIALVAMVLAALAALVIAEVIKPSYAQSNKRRALSVLPIDVLASSIVMM